MDIGTVFDWVGRIFGFAFLLFAVYVLFFSRAPEQSDDPDAAPGEQRAQADLHGGTRRSDAAPQEVREQQPGKGVLFPHHRRAHH